MVETNKSKKAEALWQTLHLSSASYDRLIFLLLSLHDDYPYFGISLADLISRALVIQTVVHANWLKFEKELGSTVACFSMP